MLRNPGEDHAALIGIRPRARTVDLVVSELPDEVLIYDLTSHKAHCLNQTAALVWRYCDGQTTVDELAVLAGRELGAPLGQEAVWLSLGQLSDANLLQEPVDAPRYSRQQIVRKAGLVAGGAVLLPVVASILAPTAMAAGSVGVSCFGKICNPGEPCCGNADFNYCGIGGTCGA